MDTQIATIIRELRAGLPLSPVLGLTLNPREAYKVYDLLISLERAVYLLEKENFEMRAQLDKMAVQLLAAAQPKIKDVIIQDYADAIQKTPKAVLPTLPEKNSNVAFLSDAQAARAARLAAMRADIENFKQCVLQNSQHGNSQDGDDHE